ncbi:MAG: glycosyltransferase family 2 protein, partial [bacterium]|nr:glycosyltransferase family 2 protein [bacterium]
MNYPSVSIIFPTFNGWQDTKKCLESISNFDYPKERIEVIVVDNGSTDETVKKVQKSKFKDQNDKLKLKIIENRVNLGFARAVNLGVKKSRGEYLLITNNDVVFDKNYLALLVEFLQNESLAGMVGGKVFYRSLKKKISFAGARFNFYTGLLRLGKYPNQTCQTDWVPGCNMLLRRQVWCQIGGFDEKFFFYFEDLDLCLRAK